MDEKEGVDFEEHGKPQGTSPGMRIAVVAVLLAAAGAWFLWGRGEKEPSPPPAPAEQGWGGPATPFLGEREEGQEMPAFEEDPLPREAPAPPESVAPPERGPAPSTLEGSDELVRGLLPGLTSLSLPEGWLKADDLVRVFVVTVDNIAEGLSPGKHLPFMKLEDKFKVFYSGQDMLLHPGGYGRYDAMVEVLASADPRACVKVYRELEPLLQEAYMELGYLDRPFEEALAKAVGRLLATPVVEGEVVILRGDKSYHFADPAIESMSQAEKHLLRMGPENMRKIQSALREIADALGIVPAPE